MLKDTHKAFATSFAMAAITIQTATTLITKAEQIALYEIPIILGVSYFIAPLPDLDIIVKKLGLPFKIKHRGVSHSIWPVLLMSFLTIISPKILFPIIYGFTLGYLSHLVGDAFSYQGIAWFYPFQQYETYGNKTWVKHRGPFIKLYRVGKKHFINPKYYWYFVTLLLFLICILMRFK